MIKFVLLNKSGFVCIVRQEDSNNNMVGDACDSVHDRDKDGVPDEVFQFVFFSLALFTDSIASCIPFRSTTVRT